MTDGTISWTAPINAVVLDPLEFFWVQPPVVKAEIKSENEARLVVTFTLQDVFHEEEAIRVTRDAIEVIAGRLALELSCGIGEFRCIGWSLPKDASGSRHIVVADLVDAYEILEGTTKPGRERIEALLSTLQKAPAHRDRYLSLFRFSARQSDPIARFMFLYNLLLVLKGDKQPNVDAQIKAINDKVPVTINPHNGQPETLFTRLRNEIAHVRSGFVPANTLKEVNDHVGEFQEIVRRTLMERG